MSEIKIEVWDATGNKRQLVEVPADAEVNRLIAVLIERMNLPRHSPDGQLMSYKFHHKRSGRQLLDTETLLSAKVEDGDVLRLQPEITAGSDAVQPPPVRPTKACPMCGEEILEVARKCRHCGLFLDPTARPREVHGAVERALLPVGRPGTAIAAGYLGLFAFIPLFGLLPATLAIIFGMMALKTIRSDPTLSGRGRAWFGIIAGGLNILLLIVMMIVFVIGDAVGW